MAKMAIRNRKALRSPGFVYLAFKGQGKTIFYIYMYKGIIRLPFIQCLANVP